MMRSVLDAIANALTATEETKQLALVMRADAERLEVLLRMRDDRCFEDKGLHHIRRHRDR